ncbi:MAG TPA: hypothetical protein VHG93_24515 [Longimicrobium sp.]|nr:hypothetical protein [Longimicrobium sp.]
MPDESTQEMIHQLTLRKLAYARKLLGAHGQSVSGTRDALTERLLRAVDAGAIPPAEIHGLLNELDAWGNQRVRLGTIHRRELRDFRDTGAVRARIRDAGLDDELLGRDEVALVPPETLSPMGVQLLEGTGTRILRLLAAKIRVIDTPLRDAREIPVAEIPQKLRPRVAAEADAQAPGATAAEIIYKPYRRERQKAVSFAEIDLDTGVSVISTTLLRQGMNYTAEFGELFAVFGQLLPLAEMEAQELYDAVRRIRELPRDEVLIYSRQQRTNVGGTMEVRSFSPKVDVRTDAELETAAAALRNAEGFHCNCRWLALGDLTEEVHTHILSPTGEVSVLGQVTENSVRHVLRRIRSIH